MQIRARLRHALTIAYRCVVGWVLLLGLIGMATVQTCAAVARGVATRLRPHKPSVTRQSDSES